MKSGIRISVIKAFILKEITELIRTRLIIMVYMMPSMVTVLFGYGIAMDVTHSRINIIDYDNTKLSRELISKFQHSKYFDATLKLQNEKEALDSIKQADTDIVLIIPSSFEKNLVKGQKVELGVFIDAAFANRASTMQSYVQGVILSAAAQNAPMISLNTRTLFNQAMRDEDAIVPGLIGLVLLVAPAILTALLIVKEKEKGTIFNFYASPINKFEFLIAKLLPVFLLHSLNIFILFLWATLLFKVPFRGSFFLYWMSSEMYILISLSIGMLISIVTSRQIVAVVMTVIITILPAFLYSGMLMPISSMQGASWVEAHLFPVMYYNHILYDTFLIGQGFDSSKIVLYLFIMAGFFITLLTSGVLLLKKEMR
ncbi:ABC transporter permease [Sulfurimonas sp. HSL-1716]|uniref:ABC transporter permease n=1 Tax=Hydrocurvibacter sulfurireducens TaxID=3131937 RepID=UPI0031F8F330